MAAKEEGIKEVPCIFIEHLTEAQKRAYIIADNKLAMNAGWDDEMLSIELSDLQGADFDLDLLGFDPAEIDQLLNGDAEAQEDEFDVDAELEKPTFSKTGDLWLLGNHRLVCGDSTKQETYDVLMDGKLANLTVTDPPYNVNYEGSAGKIKMTIWQTRRSTHSCMTLFLVWKNQWQTMPAFMCSMPIRRD